MADVPQERRTRYWLWGVAGWLAITVLCLLTNLGALETTLAERSQTALAQAGLAGQITNSEIQFTGEIATLKGTVTDAALRDQIGAAVADVRGVRVVKNEIAVVAPAPTAPEEPPEPAPTTPAPASLRPPTLAAVVDGGTVTLTGEVPTQQIATAWRGAAAAAYGDGNVVDQLTVTDEVRTDDWLADADAVRLLESTSDGSITIADDRLVVTGLVPDQATHDEIISSLTAGFPGLQIDNRLEIEPQAGDAIDDLALANIRFESGSARITADSIPILDEAVAVLAAFPNVRVEIAGHTDSDGSAAANLALSQARADAVLEYLVDHGIAAERLTAVGYGETQPIADNATPEGKAQNRRIEFIITEDE